MRESELRRVAVARGVFVVATIVASALLLGGIRPTFGPGALVLLLLSSVLASTGWLERRPLLLRLAGVPAVITWLVDVGAWLLLVVVLGLACASAAVCDGMRRVRGQGWGASLGAAVGAPALLVGIIFVLGGPDAERAVLGELALALPPPLQMTAVVINLAASVPLAMLLMRVCLLPEERLIHRRLLIAAASVGTALLLAWRFAHVGSILTLPTDMLVWSEAPFLLNLLKLERGETFYGPLELVNSYAYSPLMELTHRVILAPFGLVLSLLANRLLAIGWQLLTAAVLTWAVAPWARRMTPGSRGWLWIAVPAFAAASFSSFLSPHLHPDHALLSCYALAIAWLLRGHELPAWARYATLFLLPPISTMLKLTGAGIGFGLVLAASWLRDVRALLVLAVSGAISLATIPLFDATLGHFTEYAITLQASHPIVWGNVPAIFLGEAGRLAWLAMIAVACARWTQSWRADRPKIVAVLALMLGFMIPSALGFLKYGGRVNSLMPLVLGSTTLLFVALPLWLSKARRAPRRDPMRAALALVAFWIATLLVPMKPPVVGQKRRTVIDAHALAVQLLKTETEAGRCPLLYGGTAAWLDAGRRDVPLDRLQSANELHFALGRRTVSELPALHAHIRRLAAGTYDTIVGPAEAFRVAGTLAGGLGILLRDEVLVHYELIEPRGPGGRPTWPASDVGVVAFRRKPGLSSRHCEPRRGALP